MRALDGRRIWFAGIGGAGLSGYAIVAKAWGAEVGGWDKVETPYLPNVRAAGIRVELAAEPVAAPAGWETVVSTACPTELAERTLRVHALDARDHECLDRGGGVPPVVLALHCE